ncbi:innexin inx4-like isoform X2 [Sitodiplosis mosellana]|uniref:innexin inx4-like isoform X2 n=1 Tax=Sitodiplosis mosellana TaxID=263140 RepID=UPI002443B201|nr:innexin inx4-like isoform X2 [Sitodiplosis mosellana]
MYKSFVSILNLVKVESLTTSDFFFIINTKFTPILLLFFATLLTTMDILRTSIDCYPDSSGNGRKAIMDNFCWSFGTYTCKNQTNNCFNPSEENKVYQRYYQWISLLFVLGACVLHTPAYLWTQLEGGLMHKICTEIDSTFKEETWNRKKKQIMAYFRSKYVDRLHMKYVQYFIALNILCSVLILLNIMTLNIIIPGFWNHYHQAILALVTGDSKMWMFHSELIFPRLAKCSFEPYGPSGSNQQLDALCLLSLNVVNQKIFIIVWIWYILQMTISILNLLHWILITTSKKARIYILCEKTMKSISHKVILDASCEAHLGHFFVLNQIARNTSPDTFVELMSELANQNVNMDDLDETT